MRTMEEVKPIQSDAEYQQVLAAIQAASAEVISDERLLALKQRVAVYEQRLRIDPERLRALEELTSRSNWAKDSSTLSISLPIEVVVLNCCVTATNDTPWASSTSTILAKSAKDRVSRSTL